jgi:hypothetical protein
MVSLLAAMDIAPDPFEPGGSGMALLGAAALVAGVVLLARLTKRPRKGSAYFLVGGLGLIAVGVLLVRPYLFPQRTRYHGPPQPYDGAPSPSACQGSVDGDAQPGRR